MNDHVELERTVAEHIANEGVSPPADAFYDELITRAHQSGQRPEWLALIRERPMRTNSHLAVGSPTARVAAVLAATFLLAVALAAAGVAGRQLLAADGAIIVDQSGNGTTTTIAAAVEMAQDGDTILVRPGTYVEAVVIDKDITLSGDGERDLIVIEAPVGGPVSNTGTMNGEFGNASYAVLLKDTESTVSGLTFRGESARLHAKGGAPVLEDLLFEGVGTTAGRVYVPQALIVTGRTRATIRGNTLTDGGGIQVHDRSSPLVESNVLTGGPNIMGDFGPETIVRGNSISHTPYGAVVVTTKTTAVIEDNVISDVPTGIWVGGEGWVDDPHNGYDPFIRGNTISAVEGVGIEVALGALPTIEANVLTDTGIAIRIVGSDPRVADNELRDNGRGIRIAAGSPTLEGNTITGGTTGIALLDTDAAPSLTSNTVCDNETNVALSGGAQMPDTVGNDICEDGISG